MSERELIPPHILDRKGPRSLKDLNPEVVEYLNKGLVETKNLMEWLATDQLGLLKLVLEMLDKSAWYEDFEVAVNAQKKPTANSNTKVIGETLGLLTSDEKIYNRLNAHTSDLVRCWACWAQSTHHDSVPELLKAIKPYAADTHFGVREVVIFATKERMMTDLDTSVELLTEWTTSNDENVRRFAAESMRPIGVWTKKIPAFQEDPAKALSILNPLKSDASKYVRDAVANWLNDASKSQPDWVTAQCTQWKKESDTKETAYIIKRGMRTILKK
ncbi:DNA alkylation repair protein [uncultured Kordia sp.]|uniref:DNA alkylation repair protein n=1 Tax=uncultured Kordia sp. TaxID=507699 RepID=UPI0026237047|nr:DNA alkylation repair protein [uncultured Kordia sp.]